MSRRPLGGIVSLMKKRESGRTVGCLCGHRIQGADDAVLRHLVRAHVDLVHPELAYSEEQVRRWVATGARDAIPAGPFASPGPKEVVAIGTSHGRWTARKHRAEGAEDE